MDGEAWRLVAAESSGTPAETNSQPARLAKGAVENRVPAGFRVVGFTVEGSPVLSTNVLIPLFSKYAGPNVSLEDIAKAAADLQRACQDEGYPSTSVAIASGQITNGIVTMNVFQAMIPQIVVNGRRYPGLSSGLELAAIPATNSPQFSAIPKAPPVTAPVAATNAPAPEVTRPAIAAGPASPEEVLQARTALFQHMKDEAVREKDTRIHVVSTNAGPRFAVEKYLIMGNSVLAPPVLAQVLTNIDGAYGTNVSFDGIRTALGELQGAYRDRGYVTVSVGLPQQKLTNAMVKVQVTEGRLAVITVKGNQYYSSNNVMRALPSLHTNIVLNGPIFQAELNRANANQDRQIYPVVGPGPDPGTSALTLRVKDQLPLHGKVEFNNESSPGTPDLRINSSAVYNNLWNLEHALGVQYSFSPQEYKSGNWPFYDRPLVATYSAFYRLPLGNPVPLENMITTSPGNFGYDEATRKFNLPPPTGQPDLTLYASRSTIDTGLQTLSRQDLTPPGQTNLLITQKDVQQSLTINQDIGGRLSLPYVTRDNLQLNFSGGLDFKTYQVGNYKTNLFLFTQYTLNGAGQPNPPIVSTVASPVPATVQQIQYLPLSLRADASFRDDLGATTLGMGLSVNPWYTSQTYVSSSSTDTNGITTSTTTEINGSKSLQGITGSSESTGHWVVLTPSFTRTFMFWTNWLTTFRADGQWASEPLISNEQYGIGGVNSVRGYHEGEAFGDTGWHMTLEQQTPSHLVGNVYGRTPLTLRGSVYMDLGDVYLLDPQGRAASTKLWGTGFGVTAAVGSHWQTRFLFSLPLIGTSTTSQDEPYFNFSLSAQF